jgi:hypothetical protein
MRERREGEVGGAADWLSGLPYPICSPRPVGGEGRTVADCRGV